MADLIVLTDEQIHEIGVLAACLSQEQIADFFGIHRNSLRAIFERQPAALVQYKIGRARAINEVAGSLIMKARGGDVGAAAFYLKTQAGWKETKEVVVEERKSNPINIIDAMSVNADSTD